MKVRNIEDRLALLGAVIVLVGVTIAAGDALAADDADVTVTAVAIHRAGTETLADAEKANHDAAAQAAASLAVKNWVDLDIRLDDRTSRKVAGRRKAR